jgi:hypothetical protein
VPEKIPDKELDEKTARPEVLPITSAIPRPQPVELEVFCGFLCELRGFA